MGLLFAGSLLLILLTFIVPNNALKVKKQAQVLKVDEKRTTPLLNALNSAFLWKGIAYSLGFAFCFFWWVSSTTTVSEKSEKTILNRSLPIIQNINTGELYNVSEEELLLINKTRPDSLDVMSK